MDLVAVHFAVRWTLVLGLGDSVSQCYAMIAAPLRPAGGGGCSQPTSCTWTFTI